MYARAATYSQTVDLATRTLNFRTLQYLLEKGERS